MTGQRGALHVKEPFAVQREQSGTLCAVVFFITSLIESQYDYVESWNTYRKRTGDASTRTRKRPKGLSRRSFPP
jgi:hypothetical protein